MKVKIDLRPVTDREPEPFFAIRLFPETNEEIAAMEWPLSIRMSRAKIVRIAQDELHYAVIYDKPRKLRD